MTISRNRLTALISLSLWGKSWARWGMLPEKSVGLKNNGLSGRYSLERLLQLMILLFKQVSVMLSLAEWEGVKHMNNLNALLIMHASRADFMSHRVLKPTQASVYRAEISPFARKRVGKMIKRQKLEGDARRSPGDPDNDIKHTLWSCVKFDSSNRVTQNKEGSQIKRRLCFENSSFIPVLPLQTFPVWDGAH